MIIREAKIENIPVIGIVNSNTSIDISYPIFGNNRSLFSVFFFSHLISYWISTHMRFMYEKRNILINRKLKYKKKSVHNLQKTNSQILFQKRYICMIYKFRKFLQKELLYNTYLEQADYLNTQDYKKKLQVQRKTRRLQDNLIFSPARVWSVTTRWITLTRSLQHNLYGGISFTSNFLGKHFWLYFRKFLLNPIKKATKKTRFLKSYKWSKQLKLNWKWLNFGKKKVLKNSRFLRYKKKKNKKTTLIKKNWVNRLNTTKLNKYNNKVSKPLYLYLKKNHEKNKYKKKIPKGPNKRNTRFFKSKK